MTMFVAEDATTIISTSSTAIVSAIASVLIIFIITKSEAKTRTVYHRLLLMMSIANIFYSVSVALATLPMPAQMEDEFLASIDWAGPRIGNSQTCTAQGFFFIFGLSAMFSYYGMLCFYYACAIAFRIRERNIVRYIEPLMHIASLGYALFAAILPLSESAYMPTPYDTWCTIAGATTTNTTTTGGEGTGEAPSLNEATKYTTAMNVYIVVLFFSIVICFALIIARIIHTGRSLSLSLGRNILRQSSLRREQNNSQLQKLHATTKVVLVQALGYVLAFVISLSFTLTRAFVEEDTWMIRLSLVFGLLQGTFNFIIFVGHKVYNYRRVHPDTSRCSTLRLLFSGSANDEILFSRINIVRFDEEERIIEYEAEDEMHHHFVGHVRVENSENGENSKNDAEALESADDVQSDHDLSGFSSPSLQNNNNVSSLAESSGGGLLSYNEEGGKNNSSMASKSGLSFSSKLLSLIPASNFSNSSSHHDHSNNDGQISYDSGKR